MFTRLLPLPARSFFLFGPRGSGKTTWLRQKLPQAKWFDLLRSEDYLSLLREPQRLRMAVEALPRGAWVVVDEVQKLPRLLDEVHGLLFAHRRAYRFALSGSSARKLRRMDANLLAGRVITRTFLPLTGAEIGASDPDRLLRFGCLPQVVDDRAHAVDTLEAYAATYLREEIRQETLVANVESYSRFLEVAALANGQVTNVQGLARDAGVARPTVQRYFETLVDTLIGVWVRPWRPRLKVREAGHPKFYFFDTGVSRALAGRLRDPLGDEERGALLETLVLHELRSRIAVANLGGEVRYWRTPAGVEVDFIWSSGGTAVALEVKASRRWRSEYSKALVGLLGAGAVRSAFGVYLGTELLRDRGVVVLPLPEFQRRLAAGKLIG